jgi:hypothetical protein
MKNTIPYYQVRKSQGVQKLVWLPFDTERTLKEAAAATGMTEKEIILRGINLVASQERVAV